MGQVKRYREDSYAVCPYYKKESTTEIKCCSALGNQNMTIYGSERQKDAIKVRYCNNIKNHTTCPVYEMLLKAGK